MEGSPISQDRYLEASQLFHWATKEHFVVWLTGSPKRHRRTEIMLHRLSNKSGGRSLFATNYGKRLVYSCPRKVRHPKHILTIPHGLGCTEIMVRLYRSNMMGVVIEERFFRSSGVVPEFGIWYPGGKTLLIEFSTESDFNHTNRMQNKLLNYKAHLWQINERFKTKGIIVFVMDVSREEVQRFVLKTMPAKLPVFFTDYETFKNIPIGNQLSAPIYIWGEDGKSYPLTENAQL